MSLVDKIAQFKIVLNVIEKIVIVLVNVVDNICKVVEK